MGQQVTIMALHLIKQTAAELVETRPASTRAGALAVASALVLLVNWVLSPMIGSLEERVGALGWTLSPETVPEQRITLVVIDEDKSGSVDAGDTLIILTGLSTAGGLDASDFI